MKITHALLLCLSFILTLPSLVQADDGKLVIACYNVENMFDVFDDPYTDDQNTDVKSREEVATIAKAIQEMDADIVAFSELENLGLLHAMVDEFLPNMGYVYVDVIKTNSGRGINLGVMSRYPILSVTSYRHRKLTLPGESREWRFARDLMKAEIQLGEDEDAPILDLFAVHLKSKRTTDNDPKSAKWRLAEAIEMREIIEQELEEDPDRLLAIVGDFNDTPDSDPVAQFIKAGLFDAHAKLPAANRITYLNKPFRSTIDYIFVSRALAIKQTGARVILNSELTAGSDHAPLTATFDLSQ